MPRKKYASLEDRLIANSRINETESYGGTRCWDWVGTFGTGGRGDPYPQMSLRVNGSTRSNGRTASRLKSFAAWSSARMTTRTTCASGGESGQAVQKKFLTF